MYGTGRAIHVRYRLRYTCTVQVELYMYDTSSYAHLTLFAYVAGLWWEV